MSQGQHLHQGLCEIRQGSHRVEDAAEDEHRGQYQGDVVIEKIIGTGERGDHDGRTGEAQSRQEKQRNTQQRLPVRDCAEQEGDQQDGRTAE